MAPRREDFPHDRMTRICDDLINAFEASEWSKGHERVMVFVSDDDTHHSGIGLHNFENDSESIPYVIMHLTAICEASGAKLNVFTGQIGHD